MIMFMGTKATIDFMDHEFLDHIICRVNFHENKSQLSMHVNRYLMIIYNMNKVNQPYNNDDDHGNKKNY